MNLYEAHEKIFEWQQFPGGRARFAGGIRGWDERGYDTFAVELEGARSFTAKSLPPFSPTITTSMLR